MNTEFVRTLRVGEMYQPSERRRETTVRVDEVDIIIIENLWNDVDDKFETEKKWTVTVDLNISADFETAEQCMLSTQDNARILKALAFLDYELHSMEDASVGVWDRPAGL